MNKTQHEQNNEIPLLIKADNNLIISLIKDGRGNSKNYNLFIDSLKELSHIYNGLTTKYIFELLGSNGNRKVIKRLNRYLKKAENDGVIFKELKGQFRRSNFKFKQQQPCISVNLNNNGITQAINGLTYNQLKRDVVKGLNFKVKTPSIL